jgi:hypothetical protein
MASPFVTRVVHCKRGRYDVYVGRPSIWGNPFSHLPNTRAQFQVATREEAVARYEEWVKSQPELMALLPTLKDQVLGCWCAPQACHADVLAKLADAS